MTKRLQVRIDEAELLDIQRIAQERGMTTAEWVRTALRAAVRAGARATTRSKLDAVRTAMGYSYPIADVDQLLSEIEG
jgi:hypothetical protein